MSMLARKLNTNSCQSTAMETLLYLLICRDAAFVSFLVVVEVSLHTVFAQLLFLFEEACVASDDCLVSATGNLVSDESSLLDWNQERGSSHWAHEHAELAFARKVIDGLHFSYN